MDNSIPFWETEPEKVIDTGKQRFAFYKEAGIIEISALLQENGTTKAIRRQALSASKVLRCPALVDMLLDWLEDAGIIGKAE